MNYSFRNKRLRLLSDEEIRLALEADIPSRSEDERLCFSDYSDLDNDYRPPSDYESEMDTEECLEQNDSDKISQVTLTVGGKKKNLRTDESTVESEPASKRGKT